MSPPQWVLPETIKAYDDWVSKLNLTEHRECNSNHNDDDFKPLSRSQIIKPKHDDIYTEIKRKVTSKELNKNEMCVVDDLIKEQSKSPKYK